MKIIHISYRLPISIERNEQGFTLQKTSGGLVSALSGIAQASGNESRWMGIADFPQKDWEAYEETNPTEAWIKPVFLRKMVKENFYYGFSNSVLWPLFHYFPSFVEYKEDYFEDYLRANELVAASLLQHYQKDDTIFIHDYHFIPLAYFIRKQNPNAKIGFFLHIPFPHVEIFRILPQRVSSLLLSSLLSADLIGFQTWSDAGNFISNIEHFLGLQHVNFQVTYQQRCTQIGVFPISIDIQKFADAFSSKRVIAAKKLIQKQYPEQKIIFSVDRLDYTKGILYRLQAFELLLHQYPAWREKVVFILVVVPSRDEINKYWERKQMIESKISRLNGKYGSYKWTPVVYQYQSLEFDNLVGLYNVADVALISPIKDGMNLVAKEFVATRQDLQGVLMLSEFAGAANELKEALLFNPLDTAFVADQIVVALDMPLEEQARRMKIMQAHILKNDVTKWATNFIEMLEECHQAQSPLYFDSVHKQKAMQYFSEAKKRLLLLDYDGTLVKFTQPHLAAPGQELIEILQRLALNPQNKLCIVSGRDQESLENWLGELGLDMVAEHGAFVKQKEWIAKIQPHPAWKASVLKILTEFADLYPSSHIEEKKVSIAWHYRELEEQVGFDASKELLSRLKIFLDPSETTVVNGNKVIEVRSARCNKGLAYHDMYDDTVFDFVLAIGDDKTDEDLFAVLNDPKHHTIKVGRGPTKARFTLDTVQQVISLLAQLQYQ